MGEPIFRKVFPYFFPLADSYVRAIRYIRYNLELKMDLMVRNVVYLDFMDRVKQIRIPHPLPKAPVFERKWVLFSSLFSRTYTL